MSKTPFVPIEHWGLMDASARRGMLSVSGKCDRSMGLTTVDPFETNDKLFEICTKLISV